MITLHRWNKIPCRWNDYVLDSRYYISITGEIYDIKTDKILKQSIDRYGYYRVGLRFNHISSNEKVWRTIRIHQLMSFAYLGNSYDDYHVVNHKDGNKKNNHIDNLEICTYSYNTKHAYDLGLEKKYFGESNHNSKYTDKDTEKIAVTLAKYPRYPYQYILKLCGFTPCRKYIELARSIESGKSHPYLKDKYNLTAGKRYISKGSDDMMWMKVEKICVALENGTTNKKELLRIAGLEYNDSNLSNLKHIINRTGYKSIIRYFNY